MKFYYAKYNDTKFVGTNTIRWARLYSDVKKQLEQLVGTPLLYQSRKVLENNIKVLRFDVEIVEVIL